MKFHTVTFKSVILTLKTNADVQSIRVEGQEGLVLVELLNCYVDGVISISSENALCGYPIHWEKKKTKQNPQNPKLN